MAKIRYSGYIKSGISENILIKNNYTIKYELEHEMIARDFSEKLIVAKIYELIFLPTSKNRVGNRREITLNISDITA